jgi:hypothetical protein
MPLFLAESPLPPTDTRDAFIDQVSQAVTEAGAELIEIQFGLDTGRLYAIVQHTSGDDLERDLVAAGVASPNGVVQVRLVGPSLDDVKAARGSAGYLVEWDLPAGLAMEDYLARKRAKAPLYAQVPETTFLRTYVCEDMTKCLCFYRAPDEAAVLRARQAVDTPVDRVTRISEATERALA